MLKPAALFFLSIAAGLARAEAISYNDDVQPILTHKCIACHACYDAPCQLNLGSGEGMLRGASKQPVYDGTRSKAQATTRLYLDAQGEAAWRKRDFHSVLDGENGHIGLVGITGVRSRWVTVAGGVIMLILGLLPKMAALVEAVPVVVLGGAGLVMFGMVAATGVRILSRVDFANNRHNLFIVAIAIGMGMIPMIAGDFDQWLPRGTRVLTHSGILLAAVSAGVLNWFFNGARHVDQAELTRAAAQADAH